jgi:hypothetical protein
MEFVRNEHILFGLDDLATRKRRHRRTGRHVCQWNESTVAPADVVVLNRGLHRASAEVVTQALNETLSALARIPPPPSGRARRIIYRATHSPVPGCNPLARPSNVSLASRLNDLEKYPVLAKYHWHELPEQNEAARCVAASHGAAYLDVWPMMMFRPDAAMSAGDCVHSCLPGPVDEWSRMLLAFLIDDASSREPGA